MKNASLMMVLLVVMTVSVMAMPKPKVFVQNDGRWPADVLYSAAAPNAMLWITTKGMIVDMRVKDADGRTGSTLVRYDVKGSAGSRTVTTQTAVDAPTVSILTANRSSSALNTASTVVVRDVVPGVHIEYVWEGENVRYNVHADAGVTPPSPLFAVDGANKVFTTRDGISSATSSGTVTMTDIVSYQSNTSDTRSTTWNASGNAIGFDVAKRNMRHSLTIDPIVRVISIGGNADEEITVLKRRADGTYIVGGWTTSTSFGGIMDGMTLPNRGAAEDGFVAIVSADMKTVLHWTYIAGAGDDRVRDVTVDGTGQIVVVGETNSANFSVKGTPLGQVRGALKDGFVVVLSSDLSLQVRGMYLPGNKDDVAAGVAVDAEGRIVIVGSTSSDIGITTFQGYDPTPNGLSDGFIYVLNQNFLGIETFTYFGGSGIDQFHKVVIDANNNAIICGMTASSDFETFPKKILVPDGSGGGGKGGEDEGGDGSGYKEVGNNAFQHLYGGGSSDAVVVKFTSLGGLVYSTYFGGVGADDASGVFVDTDGDAFIAGNTSSNNLPIENSMSHYGGRADGFVASITADGIHARGASYIGGTSDDYVTGIIQYAPGIGLLVGITNSSDFQTLGVGSIGAGGTSVKPFLARMTVNELKFATVLGMLGEVRPSAVAKDQYNDAIIAGRILQSAAVGGLEGTSDIFLSKWAFGTMTYKSPLASEALCAGKPVTVKWSVDGIDASQPNAVDFTVDNGTTWTEIGTDIKAREYTYTIPGDVPVNAQCMFRVRAMRGHVVSSPAALSVFSVPTIVEQPVEATPCPTAAVTLAVEVAGGEATYQWRKDGAAISGATSNTYQIPSAQTSDNGMYDVVVTNQCLNATSNAVAVSVSDKPIIDAQPVSKTVNAGETVVLSVTVRGWNPTYKWQMNGTDMQGAGTDQPTLTLQNVTANDAGTYRCVISSSCGTSTTDDATVAINGTTDVREESAIFGGALSLRPQPASDIVTVGLPAVTSQAYLVIRNMQGNEMLRMSVTPNAGAQSINVSTSALPSGTYHVQLLGTTTSHTTLLSVIR